MHHGLFIIWWAESLNTGRDNATDVLLMEYIEGE